MPINNEFVNELRYESGLTQKMLERVPMDKHDWRPHDKSMTLGRLASHIADVPHWVSDIINIDDFDFMVSYKPGKTVTTQEELMQIFKERLDTANKDLLATSDEAFSKKWTVRRGEQVFFELPKKAAIRGWAFSHLVHHRGQLSVYLRLLNVAVPGMYGPSADETM